MSQNGERGDPRPSSSLALSSWQFDGVLTNGEAVRLRALMPEDAPELAAFLAALPFDARQHRFGTTGASVSDDVVARLVDLDFRSRMGFVAVVRGAVVGFAGYDRLGPDSMKAEVAFVVGELFHRHGVATLLFEGLAAYARRQGITEFVAEVMGENVDMLNVFGATGLRSTYRRDAGTVQVEIDLQPTPEYLAACDAREATAETASVASLLAPRTIAVVGAGRRIGSVGHEVVQSLLNGGFTGRIFPVNPNAAEICGLPAHPTLTSLPEAVDLAIVAVPAAGVPDVVAEAAAIGVRAVTVITAGFAETGRSGAAVESEMLDVARESGMRIVGPNCLGVVNTNPGISMYATFAKLNPPPGRLAVISQSGAVGIVLVEQAQASGLGLSCFVSVGNKLDVSSNDLLCYLENDERTSVVALYLESFGNPRKFARIARRVATKKPIVALKAGRTSAGARGARSHTAAAATPEVTVSALLRQSGVIKVDRLEELLDVSAILLEAPLPKGRRVALVGNSGGPLILAADACEENGLEVPELSEATRRALHEVVVPAAATTNPVDLTADGTASTLEQVIEIVSRAAEVDAVIVVTTDLVTLSGPETRAVVARFNAGATKPIVTCILGGEPAAAVPGERGIAEVPSPERTADALGNVCRYAEWRSSSTAPSGDDQAAIQDPATVQQLLSRYLSEDRGGGWMDLEDAARLLAACGLPVLPTRGADDAEHAVAIANELGFPVAMKARSGTLVHKSDVGGVAIGLDDEDAVHSAFAAMSSRLGAAMGGVVLQPMAPRGVEAIVGLAVDPAFGPVVMVGLGGVLTDLLGDHAFAVPPLGRDFADGLIGTLRAAALLDGYRGAPVVDRKALAELVWRVASLSEEVPELAELDLNPVVVTEDGVIALDCKVRLAPLRPGPGPLFRSLRPVVRT